MQFHGQQKLPFDEEVEASVIGTMLHDEKSLYEGMAKITADYFFIPFYQVCFEILCDLVSNGPPKFRELARELMARKALDHERLAALEQMFVTGDRFSYWLNKLLDLYQRREARKISYQIAEMAINETATAKEILEVAEAKLVGLAVDTTQDEIYSPKEYATSAYEQFLERLNNPKPVRGIRASVDMEVAGGFRTDGFPGIDDAMSGFQPGDLIILAAQSGHGKTAFALNISRLLSIEQNYFTFYQNTEMEKEELTDRLASQISGVDFKKIYNGFGLTEAEIRAVGIAYEKISRGNLHLSRLPELTPQKSRSLARKFKLEHGRLDLLVIDYIGRMELEFGRNNMREDQVLAQVARESKKLAQELQCTVLLLAQLNEDRRIEGARRIKNDADGVFFLEPAEDGEEGKPANATHKLIKYKVRRGETGGVIWVLFRKQRLYMTEVRAHG